MKRMHRAGHLIIWVFLAICLIALLTVAWLRLEDL